MFFHVSNDKYCCYEFLLNQMLMLVLSANQVSTYVLSMGTARSKGGSYREISTLKMGWAG